MKLASLVTTVVSVPSARPCSWSIGTGMGTTRTILELTTDEGLTGLGECEGSAAAILINKVLAPRLVGLSIHDLDAVRSLHRPSQWGVCSARGACC